MFGLHLITEKTIRQFFQQRGPLLAEVMRDMDVLENDIVREGERIIVRTRMCGVVISENNVEL